MAKTIIVDQWTNDEGGHYLSFSRHLVTEYQRIGADIEVWCNSRSRSHFLDLTSDVFALQLSTEAAVSNENVWHQLDRLRQSRLLGTQDHIVIHSLSVADLAVFLKHDPNHWLTWPHLSLSLRYDPYLYAGALENLTALASQRAYGDSRLAFFSDTKPLCDAYSKILGQTVHLLPVPVNTDFISTIILDDGRCIPPLTFGFLGDARREKCFHELIGAVDLLYEDYVATGQIAFVLQCNQPNSTDDPHYSRLIDRIKKQKRPGINLIEGPFPEAEYLNNIARCDIVMLPYHTNQYRRRSSGILIEASAMAKPVIVPAETWMAGRVSPEQSVVIPSGSDILSGIKTALIEFEKLTDGAIKHKASIIEENSYSKLVSAIEEFANK